MSHKRNQCYECTNLISNGVRIIRQNDGEVKRKPNLICNALNISLYNLAVCTGFCNKFNTHLKLNDNDN